MSDKTRQFSDSGNGVIDYGSANTTSDTEYAIESTALLQPQSKQKDSAVVTVTSLYEYNNASSKNYYDLEDNNNTKHNVFADPDVAAYYKRLYEKADYEGRHVLTQNLPGLPKKNELLYGRSSGVCLYGHASCLLPSTWTAVTFRRHSQIIC